MTEKIFAAGEQAAGKRIDAYLSSAAADITRSAVQRLIDGGNVLVNGKIPSKNYKLRIGDRIVLTIPDPILPEAVPENIPLNIVYEDDDLLVVNKPKNMVVHPAAGNFSGTLVNALLYHCGSSLSGINGVLRPGIVHRIDKDTSGLLIVAKNDFSHHLLAEQIKEHSFTRKYQAVVYGNLKNDEGTVDLPIGRHPTDRKKMTVTDKNSRNAITHYKVLGRYSGFTHLELTLETGRTHQIRVHMAHIGHPVAGDPVYGPKKVIASLGGQCLHAYYISFVHPRTGEVLTLSSELPAYFTDFLNSLKI
ncbi:MAG: RluA family pseudouridine synthase [Clostridia bacterium]|nr:RluA family pseudouridine synthase [Clostridia bacterium]